MNNLNRDRSGECLPQPFLAADVTVLYMGIIDTVRKRLAQWKHRSQGSDNSETDEEEFEVEEMLDMDG